MFAKGYGTMMDEKKRQYEPYLFISISFNISLTSMLNGTDRKNELSLILTFLLRLCWCPFHEAVTRFDNIITGQTNYNKAKTLSAHKMEIKPHNTNRFSTFLWVVYFS